jgi:DNA-binding GntR family transcriptional regulator
MRDAGTRRRRRAVTTMSGMPAYLQVAGDLREQIRTGRLGPGDKLPSMAQLRAQYGVSNTVIRDALNELRRDGAVIGQQGKGVFVSEQGATSMAAPGDSTIQARVEELTASVRLLEERMSRVEQNCVRLP